MWRSKGLGAVVGVTGALVLVGCNLGVRPTIYEGGAADAVGADLTGDGHLDVFLGGNQRYQVLVGDGTGGFATGPVVEGPGEIFRTDAGDVNGDAHVDVLVVNSSGHAFLLVGDGTGSFASPASVGDDGFVHDAVLGDVDDDGDADLVEAVSFVGLDDVVMVRLGDGSGAFGPPTSHVLQGYFSAADMVLTDLNGDDALDLLVGGLGGGESEPGRGVMAAFVGDGAGGFGPATLHPTDDATGNPVKLAVADLNEDGHLDVVTGAVDDDPSLFLGDGSSGFGPAIRLPMEGVFAAAVDTADVDRDSHVDVIASRLGPGWSSPAPAGEVLFGDGEGSFPDSHLLETATGWPVGALADDLDSDGKIDVVLVNTEGTAVHMNRLDGRPED